MTNFNAIGVGPAVPLSQMPPANLSQPARKPVTQEQPVEQTVAKSQPSPAELNKLLGQMQSKVAAISPELQFLVDKDSGKSVIKLTNRTTSEVVWQFPSEQALQVTLALDKFQKGLMLNRNV